MSVRGALYTALALCAAPALGQEQISPDAFLDRVTGRTATFVMFQTRDLVGVEEFVRRDRTVWARANGTCAYGLVYVKEDTVCFDYDDDPPGVTHCWLPFALEDLLLVLSINSSEIQEISELSDAPVQCDPVPLS